MFGHHAKFYHEVDLLENMYDIVDEDGCILTVLDEDTLKGIPHVETPVIHAHWLKDDNNQCYCSACMDDHYRPMFFTPHPQWRYCPWCGAKMDEEVE